MEKRRIEDVAIGVKRRKPDQEGLGLWRCMVLMVLFEEYRLIMEWER